MVIGECLVSVWCDDNVRCDEAYNSHEPHHPYVAIL